jgi:hypothetical protein
MNDDKDRRRTPIARPTEERTSDRSTHGASGLSDDLEGVRPGPGPELAHEEDADEVIDRSAEERYDTPRRYEADDRDPAMPSNDSTLNTKI